MKVVMDDGTQSENGPGMLLHSAWRQCMGYWRRTLLSVDFTGARYYEEGLVY